MRSLERLGGAAALLAALTYIVGFALMLTLLNPGDTGGWSDKQKLDFLLERRALFQAWILFIYETGGLALLVLAVGLHERLATPPGDGSLMRLTTPLGLIWAGIVIASGMVASVGMEAVARLHASDPAQAVALWRSVNVVHEGLGGGVELVGGVWMLLVSSVALRQGRTGRWPHYLGLIIGIAGTLSAIPPWADLGAVFGLGQIVWFLSIGLILLRRPILPSATPAVAAGAAI